MKLSELYPKNNRIVLSTLLVLVFATVGVNTAIDPRISGPLNTLPADLRLASVIPPGQQKSVCNGFWFKTGYVCDIQKIIAYAKNDQNTLLQEEKTFNATVDKFVHAIKITNSEFNRGGALKGDTQSSSWYQQVLSGFESYKAGTSKCWAILRSLRSSSLCTTCSALNYMFYKKELLGLGRADCKSFVATCWPLSKALGPISSIAAMTFAKILKKRNRQSSYGAAFGCETDNFRESVELTTVAWQHFFHLQKLELAEAAKLEPQICEKMVSIHKPPMLYKQTLYITRAVDAFLSEYGRAATRSLSVEQTESRSLGGLGRQSGMSMPEVTVVDDGPGSDKAAGAVTAATRRHGTLAFNSSLVVW